MVYIYIYVCVIVILWQHISYRNDYLEIKSKLIKVVNSEFFFMKTNLSSQYKHYHFSFYDN